MSDHREPRNWCTWAAFLPSVLVVTVLILSGCQTFGLVDKTVEENRIKTHMKWHSGRVEVYRHFRTIFRARAVYISDEIRLGAVDWEARTRLMDPEEKEELYRNTFKGERDVHQLLLGFYTPERDLNDLEETDTSWIPYLESPDGTVTRAACFSLAGDEAKIYMRFLEWDLSWSRLYVLCFPRDSMERSEGDGWVKLVISGPAGQGEILLRTDPPPH